MRTLFSFCLLMLVWIQGNTQPPPQFYIGGEIYYTYQGMQNGEYVYRVTFLSRAKCEEAPTIPMVTVSIYDRVTNAFIKRVSPRLNTRSVENPPGDSLNNCVANPPTLCTVELSYSFDVSLPPSVNGYLLTCTPPGYRVENLYNLVDGFGAIYATYTAEIPGGDAARNSTFSIEGNDLITTCANSKFSYSFGAWDTDGDELRYYLCDAYQAGLNVDGYIRPDAPPPIQTFVYAPNFSGSRPLGPNVTVDEQSGLMTGVAPGEGHYVITICVGEYRNGVLIATQRKEVLVDITSCKVAKASLLPEYLLCKDNNTLQLSNLSSGFREEAFNWQIFSSSGAVLFTDNKPAVSYTFKDTGIYSVKLVINKGANECVDSATSVVKVYPGLKPDFVFSGECINSPTSFTNTSTASLGQINYWKWDFGDGGAWGNAAYGRPDVTGEYSPTYQYLSYGPSTVQLVVGTTYGCRDTLRRTINIINKPSVNMVHRDKVICVGDTTELWAFAPGNNFSWTPSNDMINSSSDKPLVSPTVTTVYHVRVENAAGCFITDSVRVRVTDKVFVQAMNDTTICQGDSIQLKAVSDALTYSWTNVAPQKANLRNPVTTIQATTDYELTASIGGCLSKDTVRVITVPYPKVNAGADIMICDQESAQLRGSTDGSSFSWSQAATLSASNILDPVARPKQTTRYILTAFGTGGCPKPAHDTVLVTVLPPIKPFAGRDTTAFVGVPMQLNASGGVAYEWSPAISLSATNVRNPVAIYSSPSDGIKYKVRVINEAGCADSAYITVKVYAAKPQVYVPTAFTPNGDGKNDVLRPIAVGMQIEYFHVYNRWGQLVFSTKTTGQGWDGTIGGKIQTTGVFSWVAKAIDDTGKSFFQKGTVTLIR